MSATTALEKRTASGEQPELTHGGRTYVPDVDILEKPDELLLLADVPGARADGIDISYERGLLTIHARVESRQKEDTNFILREYGVGDFVRSFQVGEGIDGGRIQAEYRHGVLTLHLPKLEAAKQRKIKVKAS